MLLSSGLWAHIGTRLTVPLVNQVTVGGKRWCRLCLNHHYKCLSILLLTKVVATNCAVM